MDHLFALSLASVSALGWLIGAFRPASQGWIRWGCMPGVGLLGLYFLVELFSVEPAFVSSPAQVSPYTLAAMCGGICAVLARPKKPKPDAKDGGQLSA